ncbi:MAG: hypothetical protein H0V17_36640 [Deltaproteobacteria bacterium]|nr:hypothetical protein [Deltaproteobacteria bacterium]
MWTRDLASADASCGGKAHGLAQLIAAGLRVPPGFVIDHRAFRVATGDVVRSADEEAILDPDPGISLRLRPDAIGHALDDVANQVMHGELPADLVAEVEARARLLGGPFAVRSSATIEDGEAGAAAGVFSSRVAVPIEELWSAIRHVWTSALTPLAATYARRRGDEIVIAVIVQQFVEGAPMTAYTRPPGAPEADEVWWQEGSTLSKASRGSGPAPWHVAEAAIGAHRGADLELIVPRDHANQWFVQARPIVHPVIAPRSPPPPPVLVLLQDGQTWTLDVTHNPDPLSTAQTDLVHRVEAAGAAPWAARVCAGYLYTAPRTIVEIATARDAIELVRRAEEIEERMFGELHMDAGELANATLEQAIDRYIEFVRIWAYELSPLIAASRKAFPLAVPRTGAVESILLDAAADGRSEADVMPGLGVLAPAWDVAVPTFAERPGLIRDAIARARLALDSGHDRNPLPNVPPDDLTHAVLAAELAEQDDHDFAHAQWLVRRAILERADELGIAREDAFWIPLDDLVRGDLDADDVRRRASGARAASTRAATWSMPVVVPEDSSTRNSGVALVGIGSGHRVTGRVRRFESLASAIVVGHGDIVVARTVTPALAVIVIGCAAIISETGSVLGHGAAMARELGIPCVVSCRDAWSQLADGMIVSIDNDRVTITR